MPKTGNITGQPFDSGVVDQINARQTVLGLNPKPDSALIYQNNKSAFLRLASSVNLEPALTATQILRERGLPTYLTGDALAKQCVLFGGVTSITTTTPIDAAPGTVFQTESFTKPVGLINDPSFPFDGAYGWGGIGSKGYVPMPGIESANVSFYNRGALQKVDLKIKVYSVEQLQIFDLLYFRIGYTMLLEWGHSLYIDNEGNLVNRTDFFTEPFRKFFQKEKQKEILSSISKERETSFYNYDAALAKVTNFSWRFNNDGSYDINLKLIGLGDVIEALKINTTNDAEEKSVPIKTQLNDQKNSLEQQRDQLNKQLTSETANQLSFFTSVPTNPEELATLNSEFNTFKSIVSRLVNQHSSNLTSLYSSATLIGQGRDEDAPLDLNIGRDVAKNVASYIAKNFTNFQLPNNQYWEKKIKQANSLVGGLASNAAQSEAFSIAPETARDNKDKTTFNKALYAWIELIRLTGNYQNTTAPDLMQLPFTTKSSNTSSTGKRTLDITQYYVRLGHMLDYIQKSLLIYDKTKDNEPIFTFNTDPDVNYCLSFPYQVSSDPLVCVIPTKNLDSKGNGWEYLTGKGKEPNLTGYFVDDNPYLGKVMNIMVNIDFIAKTLDKGVDTNGKSGLLGFLKNLLNGINDALGNVNKLDAVYDNEVNEVKIIEGSRLNIKEESPKIGIFQVYGVRPGVLGSFVKDVDFQVQLPPSMAAMATISAQSKGNIVGENATGLSKLNKGLVDRVITTKLDAKSVGLPEKGAKDDPETFFKENIIQQNGYLKSLYKDYSYQKDNVSGLKSISRDIASYVTGYTAEQEITPSPFFIPFNLSLQMDGLSGMRNYERFAISENVLPYSYRTSNENKGVIDFLIKGISHSISGNQWTTKVESLTVSSKREGVTEDTSAKDLSMLGNTNNNS